MITRKDLAPLDDTQLEFWKSTLKHRKDETLYALYTFCQDFFSWVCLKDYMGDTCYCCKNYDYCQRCKLTMVEVKNELVRRSFLQNDIAKLASSKRNY